MPGERGRRLLGLSIFLQAEVQLWFAQQCSIEGAATTLSSGGSSILSMPLHNTNKQAKCPFRGHAVVRGPALRDSRASSGLRAAANALSMQPEQEALCWQMLEKLDCVSSTCHHRKANQCPHCHCSTPMVPLMGWPTERAEASVKDLHHRLHTHHTPSPPASTVQQVAGHVWDLCHAADLRPGRLPHILHSRGLSPAWPGQQHCKLAALPMLVA